VQCIQVKRGSRLFLDVLGKLADDVASRVVLADVVLSGAVASVENAVASRDSAAKISGALPDNLGPVGVLGVAGVILGLLAVPAVDGVSDCVVTGASGKVLAVGTERSSRVLEDTAIGPALGSAGKGAVPYKSIGAVLRTLGVVDVEVSLYVAGGGVTDQHNTGQRGSNGTKSESSETEHGEQKEDLDVCEKKQKVGETDEASGLRTSSICR